MALRVSAFSQCLHNYAQYPISILSPFLFIPSLYAPNSQDFLNLLVYSHFIGGRPPKYHNVINCHGNDAVHMYNEFHLHALAVKNVCLHTIRCHGDDVTCIQSCHSYNYEFLLASCKGFLQNVPEAIIYNRIPMFLFS